jgi:hypothetical protein
MTPEEIIREVRKLRYGPHRYIALGVLASIAGIARQSLYNIAEKGTVSLNIAAKVSRVLETVQKRPGQTAAPSKRQTPILEPPRRQGFVGKWKIAPPAR